ncbi:MAG: polysaccharide pyruvyl transferase family protein [Eubacteriales bacterium]|nr:polysaccharide pyruvyl transferase family protein [Eubacteriales bacterium]
MNQLEMRIRDVGFSAKQLLRYIRIRELRRQLTRQALADLEASETPEAKNGERILFCGVPVHRNMGDQAQRYCIRGWCRENYPDRTLIELPSWPFYSRAFRERLARSVRPEDLFVLQSGYCTTSRHYEHRMHRFVVGRFPDNPVLIMPQTISFRYPRDGFRTGRIYDRHKKLLFLARDRVSFGYAKRFFPSTRVLLYPDIVTTLIGTRTFDGERDGVFLCIRGDSEKKYSAEEIGALRTELERRQIRCETGDTESDLPLDMLVSGFAEELDRVLEHFASFRAVITDRFHGTIFSLISNTPVIVLATNDHKVVTGTDWFRDVYPEAFALADSTEQALERTLRILEREPEMDNRPWFRTRYYDLLKAKWEETCGACGHPEK